ncbi:DUF1080 domain-containing protein [Micromonospora sp. PLK6-60]|uniref:OmpL47-type beta-barrel domain-containing protein n=1 Tax=Micromonospora sp. PLK6-60 TaxID=2873383 RepID=UPI001CA7A394|nr:family 16 glycoside hydrolase [Micromonospora sp. PLK6-60]MBY8874240.1 DUF1080 domain-containing protein [Micromonospora sp. PLK6-60]
MNGYSPPVRPPARRRPFVALTTALLTLAATVLTAAPAAARPAVEPAARPAVKPAAARPAVKPDRGPDRGAATTSERQLQAQVLTWTAGNEIAYLSAPATAVAGPATIVFENSAATGNTSGMQHTLTFETGDPAYNSDVDVNILADPYDANGGRWSVDVVLSPGTYRYFCAIPGHGTMNGLLVVTGGGSDTTAPTVSAEVTGEKNADGEYVGAATVALSATDEGSGVDKVEYALDGGAYGTYTTPVTVNQPGEHTVSYRATDKAGNTSEVKSVSFTVAQPPAGDTTAPTASAAVTGQRDGDGAYLGGATVTLSATDTESGVDRIEYALDGAEYATYAAPVSVTAVGAHTLTYRATDKAGNTSTPQSVSFTVVAPPADDTTPPSTSAEVTGEKNADGAYVGTATVTVTAADGGSGVDTIETSLDGQPYATYTAPLAVNQPGEHTVSYRATDKAGNTSEVKSVSFTVAQPPAGDTTAPTASAAVTGQRDGAGAYLGAATVTLSATDTESGVDRIEYALDGAQYATYAAPVSVTAVGAHTLTYRATDKAGNTSTPQSVTFTVVAPPAQDTTAPTTSAMLHGQKNADGAFVGSVSVMVTATDADSGVDRIEYSLDGQPYAIYTAPVTVNQPGAHTVSYRATDKAGNTSAAKSVSFTVVAPPSDDTTAPIVTASVAGQVGVSGSYLGSATVTLAAADTGSGVEKIEYALDGDFVRYLRPFAVDQPGEHTLSFRATDKAGNTSGTGSLTFTVVSSGLNCRVPDTRPTVWFGTTDSGVTNRPVQDDCTINNFFDGPRTWLNHAEFVDYVKVIADHLREFRLITQKERTALVAAARDSAVGKPEAKSGYQPLLDSSAASFAQWEQVGPGGFARNADGSITSKAVPGMGMLWFPKQAYQDFSLKLQWRDDAPGDGRANSGVLARFPQVHDHPDESRPEWVAVKYGHELQINDRTDGDAYKTGSVYGFDRVDLAGARVTPKGTWNDYEIRVVGQHWSIFRNGELINDYVNTPDAVFDPPRADDPGGAGRQSPSGYLGLQNHGTGDVISFRNIRVAPLTPYAADPGN